MMSHSSEGVGGFAQTSRKRASLDYYNIKDDLPFIKTSDEIRQNTMVWVMK
jgi:hypothetical protein